MSESSLAGIVASETVDEFCAAEKMSKAQLYEEWRQGRGPRYYYNGVRRRISPEAHHEYRRQREAEAGSEVGKAKARKASERARVTVTARQQQTT
jgi:hypothetical protein